MWLIKASLRNPYMVSAIVFMLLVVGLLCLSQIPVDILPVFKSPAVQVMTYYPGMPAQDIEKTITTRIERWVNQTPGARLVESKSMPGVSVIRVYFRDDVDPNGALTQTNSLALGTLPTLPPNTLPPVVLQFDPTGTLPLGILTVNNPQLTEAKVKDVARVDVRNMLGSVPGSVAPVVVGGQDRTIMIYLKPGELESRGLSPTDVVTALQKGNLMVTPGTLYLGNEQILLDTNAMADKVEEFKKLPVPTRDGRHIYLEDVANVEDGAAIQTSRVRIDGKSQVYVPVYRQGGASSLAVSNGVKSAIPGMEKKLEGIAQETGVPGKTTLQFVMDQAVYVKEAIRSLIEEGIIGAVLVGIMILLFLGNWRMTVIATLSIPLAILGSIAGLHITHNTINAMTLGGLALAIGPLVDDAIVALENIHRHRHLGKSRVRAALDGSVEVMVPVLVATLTTTIVLAPLALMPGMGGFLFRPLALAVAFAMFTSFFLSRTFVPMMCGKFLPEEPRHVPAGAHGAPVVVTHPRRGLFGRFHHRFEQLLERVTHRYERLLRGALNHRKLVLVVIALLFAGSLGLAVGIGREFFPQVDAGQITLYVRSPSELALDASTQHVADVEHFLEANIPPAEREMIVSEIGLDPDWSSAYTANSGQQDAVVRMQMTEKRQLSSQEYAIRLRHGLAEAGVDWAGYCRHQSEPTRFNLLLLFKKPAKELTESPLLADSRYHALLADAQFAKLVKADASSELLKDPAYRDLLRDQRVTALLDDSRFPELLRDPHFDKMTFSFDTGGMVSTALNYGASSPLEIQVEGGKVEEAHKLAEEIRNRVKPIRGAADVRVLQRLDAPYLFLEVDRQEAEKVHLSAYDVVSQVVTAVNSSISVNRNFWIDRKTGNQYFVAVQNPPSKLHSVEDLLNVWASTPDHSQVKLSSLVHLHTSRGAVEINHQSLYRVFSVMVNTENRDIAGVAGDINKVLGDLQKKAESRNMHIEVRGEYQRMNESFRDLVKGLAMAALLVYLLQVALFRSFVGPFIIMFTVPLGLIGVLTMLFVTHTTLNVQSEMGVIFLVGIAVNNGVLLVDFANQQRKLGAPVHKAIVTAATIRFRPILMTFLATFLDLIPMAIGFGKGSEANIPLARAVVGGLLTSTCLTLFVVPIMYTLLIKEGTGQDADIERELEDRPETPAVSTNGDGTAPGTPALAPV